MKTFMRKRFGKKQSGAAAVEFAIVLPVLVVLLFGIIEFGLLIYNQQIITNASREGARSGIVARTARLPFTGTDSIESVVKTYCLNNLVTFGAKNDPLVKCATNNSSTQPALPGAYNATAPFGNNLWVEVTYNYSFLVIPSFLPGITKLQAMRALTVMKYE